MSTSLSSDLAREKELIANLVHEVLESLHSHFPWTVTEIAVSLYDRIGSDSALVNKVFEGILTEEDKAKLDEYLPECTEDGALTSEMAAQLMNSYASGKIDFAALTSQPLFALHTEQKEECQPWDLAEQPISFDNIGDEKTMLIVKIKMKLRELAMLRGIIARREEECTTECIAIDTVLEILNFEMV